MASVSAGAGAGAGSSGPGAASGKPGSGGGIRAYSRLELLGEGTYGRVYKAKHRPSGSIVAMKFIKLSSGDADGVPPTLIREAGVLKQLSTHTHIVTLTDVIMEKKELCLIFEYVDRDLKKLMDAHSGPLSIKSVKSLLWQLLSAVDQCHRRSIMHRDLKPQNILVDKEGCLKLADFGLAREFSVPLRNYTHEVITLWYRPPEVLLGDTVYTPAVDIWSVGAIFGEMVNKKALWRETTEIEELYRIFRSLGTPTEAVWPGVSSLRDYSAQFPKWPRRPLSKLVPGLDAVGLDLLDKMLQYDPTKRISAKAALMHPWFDDLDRTRLFTKM